MRSLIPAAGLALIIFLQTNHVAFPADAPGGSGQSNWKAGVASVVITPEEPIWMAGYGARTKPAEGRLQDLYAKAVVLEDLTGKRLVLITTDLVGMRAKFTNSIADELKTKHKLTRDQVMFTSSHTHCGPLLADSLDSSVWYQVTPADEEKVRRYTQRLRGQLIEVVDQALADLKPARLSWGIGNAGFAVNRREPTPQGVINGLNPNGPVDHAVPVLRVQSPEGKLRAMAFGYACHNTTLADYEWCGDYAGYAQQYLEAAHPGATALFFMGCGGDANPLPRRSVELCQKYGHQLADAVDAVLKSDMRPVTGEARSAFGLVDLPLDKLPTRENLETQAQGKPGYLQKRAVMLLKVLDQHGKFETTYPYPIQVWQLGPQFTWIALGGEAVVDYSHRLKKELGTGTWVASYANDVMAYISSQRVLKEGGYEATITSGELAGSGWSPDAEELIIKKVHELAVKVRDGAGKKPGPGGAQDADGFVPLFNGKNLDGWQGATKIYVAETGKLVCQKHGSGDEESSHQNLFTTKEYADFRLRFEFKLEAGANNGIAVRSPLEGRIAEAGMEIQVLDDSAERYKNLAPHQYHGSIYLLAPAKRGHLKPVGEWNSEEIMFHGRRAKITLNGVVIVDVDLDNLEYTNYLDKNTGRKRAKGHIGFLGHGSRVEFRNIHIKEL